MDETFWRECVRKQRDMTFDFIVRVLDPDNAKLEAEVEILPQMMKMWRDLASVKC